VKAGLKIEGISALLRDLERAQRAGDGVAASAVEAVAEGTAKIARARIGSGSGSSPPGAYPKSKTGRLERSIAVITTKAKRTTAIVGTAQLHGRFLELGTGKMEPRPWLLPSFEDARDNETGNLAAEFEGNL
jgi:HK97 gp10 family phage protein